MVTGFHQQLVKLLKYPTIFVTATCITFSILSITAIEHKKPQRLQSKLTAPGVNYARSSFLKSSAGIVFGLGGLVLMEWFIEYGVLWGSFLVVDGFLVDVVAVFY